MGYTITSGVGQAPNRSRYSALRQRLLVVRTASLRLAAAFLSLLALSARADGIPEPSLVIYGVVTNTSSGGTRVTFGNLTWVFRPADGGTPITITGVLTNLNDQFSYVLRIPCETEITGVALSAGALKLGTSSSRYDRSQVTIEGFAASFSQTAQTNLVLLPTDRGRVERIDLVVDLHTGPALPEAWQLQYFGQTGVDPNADADGDGLSNLAEYKAGTNPRDPQSRFALVQVAPDPAGGIRIDWSSADGKSYAVQRSGDLLDGFTDLFLHIPGTPPQNSLRDPTAIGRGPYFYRIRLEP
jgi:hypothetical protein